MTDYHIHIGQFNEVYYDALDIFRTIESVCEKTRVDRVLYSSTSSCRDDAKLELVEEEIEYAQNFKSNFLKAEPYLWFLPKYAENGISAKSAASAFDYCGIKLHPAGQNWDDSDSRHKKAIREIFEWADEKARFILIHCGTQKCDFPTRFESLIAEHKNARVILAHSNPVEETSYMVNRYPNAFCDTACISRENFSRLVPLVRDKSKILFGSDFPISHYFSRNLFSKNETPAQNYISAALCYTEFISE